MKNLLILILLLLPALLSSQSYPHNTDKCYGIAKVEDKYYLKTVSYPIYIGKEKNKIKLKKKKLVLRHPRYDWVRKKDKSDSPVAQDMVSYEIVEPGEYLEIEVLKNTKKTPEEDWAYTEYEIEVFEPGAKLYKESLCPEEITEAFILKLRSAFWMAGYQINLETKIIDEELCKVLVKYQIDNDLAVGSLDIDTLKKLHLWQE